MGRTPKAVSFDLLEHVDFSTDIYNNLAFLGAGLARQSKPVQVSCESGGVVPLAFEYNI